jgi:hypothetical protein
VKKTSRLAKTLRTSIGDLLDTGCEISDEQLARVAGGLHVGGGGGVGGPGGGVFEGGKCWQASTSVSEPGTPDNAQDYVND